MWGVGAADKGSVGGELVVLALDCGLLPVDLGNLFVELLALCLERFGGVV